MRTYIYIRVNPYEENDSKNYLSFFSNHGHKVHKNRLILEEVEASKSISIRKRFLSLIKYSLKDGDLLIVAGLDCLGCNFKEIILIINKIYERNIRLICFNYSKVEMDNDLKKNFLNFLKSCYDFENNIQFSNERTIKKTGRPEILSLEQKEQVLDMYKRGWTKYSLAKHFVVSRTVIQRIIKNDSILDVKYNM